MRFSIVIPTLNEAGQIGAAVRYIKWVAVRAGITVEILVVDGGSSDGTRHEAKLGGATHVLLAPSAGRATQMNLGAARASGEVLYFLHADGRPEPDFFEQIDAGRAEGFDCGCLRLRFERPPAILRFHAWLVHWRWRMVRFGDQSLYVSAAAFRRVGGFRPSLRLFEDQDIVIRLRQACRFRVLPAHITASARSFQHTGMVRTHLAYYVLQLAFALGVSQPSLMAMRTYLLRRPPR
jgi:rSAM/selenodomain-associated transferase 2